MSTLCLPVRIILILGLFLNLRYAPNATSLMRDEGQSFAFANFAMNNFHYLNITPFIQIMVDAFEDCGLSCLQHASCFSFNVAALSDITKQKTLCGLLPSDKYRESCNFVASQQYHHFSITVSNAKDPFFSLVKMNKHCHLNPLSLFSRKGSQTKLRNVP